MKWRYLGHLQLLSNAVAAMAKIEVSPQEEMANSQGMKLFAVEIPELPEDFEYFPALCLKKKLLLLLLLFKEKSEHT